MTATTRKLAKKRRKETIDYLWTCYAKNRSDTALRDRLAEHYTPLVQLIARHYVRRYRLREVTSAIGDALLMLVLRLIPDYDGQRDFRRWAAACIRQKMLQRQRQERLDFKRFKSNSGIDKDWPEIEARLVRPKEPGAEVRFVELVAALTARDAAILWLRFCRHLKPKQIGFALGMTALSVDKQIGRSIDTLRKLVQPPGSNEQ
jgi:RNA polymerase sigma factor (sigma-70 family)